MRCGCATRCHPCARVSGPERAHLACRTSGACATGLHLLYAFASRHRLARDTRPTPLRRRIEPILLRLVGGVVILPPMEKSIFYPFRNLALKNSLRLVECIPSVQWLRLVQEFRLRTGGAREKSGRVGWLGHVYGFPSRQSANAEPRANKSLVAKNGSAGDKLLHLVRFTKQVELRINSK